MIFAFFTIKHMVVCKLATQKPVQTYCTIDKYLTTHSSRKKDKVIPSNTITSRFYVCTVCVTTAVVLGWKPEYSDDSNMCSNVTSTPGHVLTTSLLRPKKIKDVVRTWYGLVGRGRNVVRT